MRSFTGDRQSNSCGIGWEYVHVCLDDASRLAFSRILPDEKKESAVAFLKAAVAYYRSLGLRRGLRKLRPQSRRAAHLAPPIQLASAARRS